MGHIIIAFFIFNPNPVVTPSSNRLPLTCKLLWKKNSEKNPTTKAYNEKEGKIASHVIESLIVSS